MPDPYRLLQYLVAHPEGPSSSAIEALGIDPTDLHALVRTARERGVRIDYSNAAICLHDRDVALYDVDAVRCAAARVAPGRLAALEILSEVDSTNAHVAALAGQALPLGTVCLAEFQTAGRGRRGRAWRGAYGASVLTSIYWRYAEEIRLEGLSLSVGVALLTALQSMGARNIGLKWPNDVYGDGAKLAGILIETTSRLGAWHTVVGIGVNVSGAPATFGDVDQPWTTLDRLMDEPTARDDVAGCLIGYVLDALAEYEKTGFARDRERWAQFDLTAGRAVQVQRGQSTITGIARGIDARGALRIETPEGVQTFDSGEVSLRLDEHE